MAGRTRDPMSAVGCVLLTCADSGLCFARPHVLQVQCGLARRAAKEDEAAAACQPGSDTTSVHSGGLQTCWQRWWQIRQRRKRESSSKVRPGARKAVEQEGDHARGLQIHKRYNTSRSSYLNRRNITTDVSTNHAVRAPAWHRPPHTFRWAYKECHDDVENMSSKWCRTMCSTSSPCPHQ